MDIDQRTLDRVRRRIIEKLKEALQVYTENGTVYWVNEESCRNFITNLKKKHKGRILGPFWDEFTDEALHEENITRDDQKCYKAYWTAIEEGK